METKIRESQNNQFLQAGEAGRHSWWRYLATLMVIVFAVITFNVIASVIVVAITGTSDIHSMPVEWVFILAMSTFPPAVLALLFCLKSIHKRSVRTLVTPHLKPNWKWFWISGSICGKRPGSQLTWSPTSHGWNLVQSPPSSPLPFRTTDTSANSDWKMEAGASCSTGGPIRCARRKARNES